MTNEASGFYQPLRCVSLKENTDLKNKMISSNESERTNSISVLNEGPIKLSKSPGIRVKVFSIIIPF